jgi:hypothetical protein
MPPRRTRTVAPRPVDDVPLDGEENVKPDGRTRAARQVRRVQAATADDKVRLPAGERAVEVADGVITAELSGRSFRLAESIGLMPLMEWAAAQDDIDTRNSVALLGFYRVLQDLVHEDDWPDFRKHAREQKSTDKELVAFQNAAVEALAARPTEEPEAS